MRFAVCDLGGTNTRAALVDTKGKLTQEISAPTPGQSPETVLAHATGLIKQSIAAGRLDAGELGGIGLAVAGTVDLVSGTVVSSPNLPLSGVAVRDIISRSFDVPVLVDNDATAAAVAEARFGAGRVYGDQITVTIGTGIGGGIILGGVPYRGVTGAAGEVGHMVVDADGPMCGCGRQGCWEAVASGRAIAGKAREAVILDQASQIMTLAAGDPDLITGEIVAQAAADGDPTALDVLGEIALKIGVGVVNLVNIFNPAAIILGGGVMAGDHVILDTVRRVVRGTALAPNRDDATIVAAELGNRAGLLGAAALHF